MKKHNSRDHAPLSPSAAKRWMSCPGSFAASYGIVTETSEAAKEGTIAHEWAEKLRRVLTATLDTEACAAHYEKELKKLRSYDEDMAFHVDNYIDFLDKIKSKFQSPKFDEYEEYLETRVKFTDMIWGTLDFGLARRKKNKGRWHAAIADFKYGRGTYVPAKDEDGLPNPQCVIYLIGLEEHLGVRFEKAWIYIYQPRYPKDKPYEVVELTEDDISIARGTVRAAEGTCLAMQNGYLPVRFEAGDHCQFCPAQPQCPTFKNYTNAGALQVLDDADNLPQIDRIPIEALVEIHHKKKVIEHFLENVDHHLMSLAMRGLLDEHFKLVEGRSNRRWIEDEDKVALALKRLGAQPWRKKLITIGEAEKIVGKNKIDLLTTKPQGKLQLASLDDERSPAELGKDSLALLD